MVRHVSQDRSTAGCRRSVSMAKGQGTGDGQARGDGGSRPIVAGGGPATGEQRLCPREGSAHDGTSGDPWSGQSAQRGSDESAPSPGSLRTEGKHRRGGARSEGARGAWALSRVMKVGDPRDRRN